MQIPEDGLICGFEFSSAGPAREVRRPAIAEAFARTEGVTWFHFNLNDARTQRWLVHSDLIPETLREAIESHDPRCRIEPSPGGLVVVISDLTFEHESDPSEVAALWAYATERLVISARTHPLKAADDLRSAVRNGLQAETGFELVAQLFELRAAALRKVVDGLAEQADDIEDQVLRGRITEQRELLGQIRRTCSRLRRNFTPERTLLQKLVGRPHAWLEEQAAEWLRSVAEELAFVLDDVSGLQERAKLLQEEFAARVAEDTSRKLNALTGLTAVFLPMTLITGIFGMNIAGLPGTPDVGAGADAFWWTMLLLVASGAVTLGALFSMKLF
jgi:zinc transporter